MGYASSSGLGRVERDEGERGGMGYRWDGKRGRVLHMRVLHDSTNRE